MNLHRLDLVSLALFTYTVRQGSISQGAALAHLAVGAASKRIADLEAAVGATLLQRHSRGVRPTLAGQALMAHAQRILSAVDQLEADLSDHARGLIGVVRLWANTSAVTQFLPRDLAAFAVQHPGIRIELAEHDSPDIAIAVLDGRADLGILAERTPTLGLATRPYRHDRLALLVPRGHPLAQRRRVAFADCAEFDFVSLPEGTSLGQRLADESARLGMGLRIRIRVRSFDAMCQMVAAGLGVAVMPEGAARPLEKAFQLRTVALGDAWAERQLLWCARDWQALPKPVRNLVEVLA